MADPVAELASLAEHAGAHGLVVLAGAGVSMPAPSCLPGWTDFNDAVLNGLAQRAEELTGGAIPGGETMIGLRTLRDQAGALPIDFQAQLMEEECGPDYFRVLQSIDADATNGCHAAIAAMADTGVLKAIVTTNFDRLIERALDARGVDYRVFRRTSEFDSLEEALVAGGTLAVVKVHGSADLPDSMVDTLRQRVQGRPESLVRALEGLFARHALLIAGFSGADLAYDKEYLGLRAGASRSPFVVVLTRAGKDPLPAMAALIADCPTASPLPGNLPDALVSASAAMGASPLQLPPPTGDEGAIRAERLSTLAAGVGAWVDTVGDLSAINILGAVIEGATTRAAFLLFRKARPRVLRAPDRQTDGYWRFQVNFGRHLLERGYLGQDLRAAETIASIEQGGQDEADVDDAFSILTRAAVRGNRIDAAPLLARVHAYRGDYRFAMELVKRFRQAAVEGQHELAMQEAFISGATVHALVGNWSAGLEWLEAAYPRLIRFGDEPRRARLCAHLGRFLAWMERYDEAEKFLREGAAITAHLKLGLIQAELHSAWGYLEMDRGNAAEAVGHLKFAAATFSRAELTSPLLPILLDLSEAAFRADQNDLSIEALGGVEDQLDRYPGLAGHYHHRVALMLILAGQFAEARTFLARARAAGEAMGNAWVVKASNALEERIAGR
jgi:tetratricopeptide (TPR) repeat protein